jgi:Tfp pilus assembly protein PilN
MTGLILAAGIPAGYLAGWVATARFAYRAFPWREDNVDRANAFFSLLWGAAWPFVAAFFVLTGAVMIPSRTERMAARKKRLAEEIKQAERDLAEVTARAAEAEGS